MSKHKPLRDRSRDALQQSRQAGVGRLLPQCAEIDQTGVEQADRLGRGTAGRLQLTGLVTPMLGEEGVRPLRRTRLQDARTDQCDRPMPSPYQPI